MHTASGISGRGEARPRSSIRRVFRLYRVEVGRMAGPWTFWAGVVVLALTASVGIMQQAGLSVRAFGAFSYLVVGDTLAFAIPVFVGATVAGSLAADRRRGYPALVLVRGISRGRYLFVKAAAMFSVAFAGTLFACGISIAAAVVFLPGGATAEGFAGRGAMGPYPELLASDPLANDVVLAVLLSVAAGALALSGLAFGAIVANEYLAAAVPFALVIGGIMVLRGPLLFAGPYTQLALVDAYTYALPRWAWSFTAPVYWTIFALACLVVAAVAFLRREEV